MGEIYDPYGGIHWCARCDARLVFDDEADAKCLTCLLELWDDEHSQDRPLSADDAELPDNVVRLKPTR